MSCLIEYSLLGKGLEVEVEVEVEKVYVTQRKGTTVHQIHNTSGRPYDNIHSLSEQSHLIPCADACRQESQKSIKNFTKYLN